MSRFLEPNGYYYVYMPDHHRAKPNGCVAEHILVAEKKLGRPLRDGEVVHHEDEDKTNNSEDNLYIFVSNAAHSSFHNGGKRFPVGDVWDTEKVVYEIKCSVCKASAERVKAPDLRQENFYCSEKCYRIGRRVVERPSKEELEAFLRENSFLAAGREFGVSDNAVRKWCTAYGMSTKAKDYR